MNNIITGVNQIGFVVSDLEKTLKFYSEELGLNDWTRFEINENNLKECPHFTHGKEIPIEFKGAKGMVGNIEFEFIQAISDNTIYSEFLSENKPGIHHLSLKVTDFDEAYKFFSNKNYAAIQTAITPFGSKIAYFDTRDDFGFYTEIVLKNMGKE